MKSSPFSFFQSIPARCARLPPFRSASQAGTDRRAVLPNPARLAVGPYPRENTGTRHLAKVGTDRRAVLSLFLLLPLALCAALPRASPDTPATNEPPHLSAPIPQPFSAYQPIIDRMPFGAPPSNFDPNGANASQAQTDAQVQAEQQKLAKQVNMSCVNVTPEGATAIGFTDLSEKPPVNYYLLVGANANGWTVVDADYDEEWAQIRKDSVTVTLKLGKGLIDAPPPRPAAAASAGVPAQNAVPTNTVVSSASGIIRRPSKAGQPPSPALPSSQLAEMQKMREELDKIRDQGGDVKSYMDRLRERKQQEKAEKAAAEEAARVKLQELARKITEDELRKKEHEMNLSLIEQGAKPISDIELTPEEEQALVDKGVLAQ